MTTSDQLIEDRKVIDKLEKEELELLRQLNLKRDIIKKLKGDHWLKSKGLEMNDAVQFKTGVRLGEKILSGKIVGFEYSGTNPWAPRVLLFNADGNIGKVTRRLSDAESNTMIRI
jgi:hypothetical protein